MASKLGSTRNSGPFCTPMAGTMVGSGTTPKVADNTMIKRGPVSPAPIHGPNSTIPGTGGRASRTLDTDMDGR